MENERLKFFDENGNQVGTATRSDIHKKGHWHETFHCWIIAREAGRNFIYFQIRSGDKKDYPNLLDITAAGHILAEETPLEGIREVKEELGLELDFKELISLGIIKDSLKTATIIDKELCHVYLYNRQVPFEKFTVQKEEVTGIVKAEVDAFNQLWKGQLSQIEVEGFTVNEGGKREFISMIANKNSFVPHEDSYMERVVSSVQTVLFRTKNRPC